MKPDVICQIGIMLSAYRLTVYRTLMGAALLFIFVGCTPPVQHPSEKCNADDPKDLKIFPQKIEPYLPGVDERKAVLPLQRTYRQHFYRVWDADYIPDPLAKVRWPFEVYTPEDAYGENLRPLPPSWFDAMQDEAAWQKYGSIGKSAIALKRLDLRNFPTHKPLFHKPCLAGEGFPFDYLQNSAVFANEPLYLSHYSRSGAWAYVLTSYATGWVPADSIAVITPKQRHDWRRRPLLALLGDKRPVKSIKNAYLFQADTGMVLPMQRQGRNGFLADAAVRKGVRRSRIVHVPLGTDAAAPLPMRFTRKNLRRVVTPVLQTKYGWGGLFGERDCSSTIRDIFAPFGLWLPRNSYQQSKIGRVVSFEDMNDDAKLEAIKKEAKPFETLLYLKGHILLYVGLYNGEPAVLHTVWGIRTADTDGKEGRHIVGKTVISSLHLGRELEGYRREYSLLHRIESMNFILEEGKEK